MRTRRPRLSRIAALVAAVVVAYGAWAVTEVIRNSGSDDRAATDAIVVLGAAQYDGTPSPVLQRRLDHALELYRDGVAPQIVLTGSSRPRTASPGPTQGSPYLLARVCPRRRCRWSDGDSTYESLAATAGARRSGLRSV
ncbi:MAG: YdcF family protein [Microthrixaceae bacterium]|nr:YdcF family protein [Microthrixaceae bacterium]